MEKQNFVQNGYSTWSSSNLGTIVFVAGHWTISLIPFLIGLSFIFVDDHII